MAKILHVCLANFYIDNYSYQENILPKYHKKIGHEVSIVASYLTFDERGRIIVKRPQTTHYISENGIVVDRVDYKGFNKFFKQINQTLRNYVGLYSILEASAPDIIFIHGCQFWDIFKIIKYKRKHSSVKIFVDNHADFINSGRNWLSLNVLHKIIWRICAKSIEPYTEKFWGVTPVRSKFLNEIYKIEKSKIDTLVMGVDLDAANFNERHRIRKEVREELGIKDDEYLITNGGKLDKKKGTIELLSAFKTIKSDKIRLLLFGTANEEINKIIENAVNSDNRIRFIGWLDSTSIYRYLFGTDVAVYPGTHSVLWEQTIGMGIPTIIKKWSGFDHLEINDSVKSYPDITIKDIQDGILDFINNLEYYRQEGKKNMEIFSYDKIAVKSITN